MTERSRGPVMGGFFLAKNALDMSSDSRVGLRVGLEVFITTKF